MLVVGARMRLCKVLVTGVVFAFVSEIVISAWLILIAMAGGPTVLLAAYGIAGI